MILLKINVKQNDRPCCWYGRLVWLSVQRVLGEARLAWLACTCRHDRKLGERRSRGSRSAQITALATGHWALGRDVISIPGSGSRNICTLLGDVQAQAAGATRRMRNESWTRRRSQGRASESTDRDGERDGDGVEVGVGDGNSDRSTCDVEMHKKLIDRFGGHCRQRGSESGYECAWLGKGSGGVEASCRGWFVRCHNSIK